MLATMRNLRTLSHERSGLQFCSGNTKKVHSEKLHDPWKNLHVAVTLILRITVISSSQNGHIPGS